MREYTKEQAAKRLAMPNGSEKLFEEAEAAFGAAWALFEEDGHSAACAFLCRCAKRKNFRERIAELLGEERQALNAALASENPKLRKNAARLAGALGAQQDAPALIEALGKEQQRFVRPSLLLALGAVGGEAARAALEAYTVVPAADAAEERHVREEEEALAAARKSFLTLDKHTFRGLDAAYDIDLITPDQLTGSLLYELSALGIAPVSADADRVRVRAQDTAALLSCRSFFELLFPIAEKMSPVPAMIARHAAAFMLKFLPAVHAGKGPFGYRIEVRGEAADRALIAKAVAAKLDGDILVNAPGNYEAELRIVLRRNGSADLFLKLYTLADDRFSYRVGALPASMHPATAAAVLRYAREHLKSGARVLDPCCGSGTFLIERGKLTETASLTGVDIAHKAIDIARKNAREAKADAKFICNDCLRFEADRKYDEVIANLPFGNRVGSHKDNERLYAAMLDKLPHWLNEGGIAILYTMEFTLLKKLVRERKNLKLITETRTEAGGLLPGVFLIRVGK
ncbi:MAG: methyltransferase domain-containing protein [Clostridiales bacterium]|nr:methyltransferase domain-containing protein [Clostridiales bacterium]